MDMKPTIMNVKWLFLAPLFLLLSTSDLSAQKNQGAKKEESGKEEKKPSTFAKVGDKAIDILIDRIQKGKIPTSILEPLQDILAKISNVIGKEIIDIQSASKAQLPPELSKAVAFTGKIAFLKEPVNCTVIIGKEKDVATGQEKLGFSLEIALAKSYQLKDLGFLTALGVSSNALNKFGSINLPEPDLIFSTFASYTDPIKKRAIRAGLTLSTKTEVANFMQLIRNEVNNLTDGMASKLPFLAKVNDNSPVTFNVAVGFTGATFQSFGFNIVLPMQIGIDMVKLRAQEQQLNPSIKAPFDVINKPIKEVTSIVNKAPLKDIKTISAENFVAELTYAAAANTVNASFSAEMGVTTNAGVRYVLLGAIGLTPERIAIELGKAPSITSMPLSNGVTIDNIALAVLADFAVLATGVPISGLGILGEISFPFEKEKVTVGLAGLIDVSGDFMIMGSVQNLDVKKLAMFHAQLIQNLAKKVNFDSGSLTQAMQQMPSIKINNGYVYAATKEITLAKRKFPIGLGVNLDALILGEKATLSIAGNQKQLTFQGYLAEIKTDYIVISGSGPDKQYKTADDGAFIDFGIFVDKPLQSRFDMSGLVELPPVNIVGSGDISIKLTSIATKFTANVAKLFNANFDFAFDVKDASAAKIAFDLNTNQKKEFLSQIFKELETVIVNAQKGAAKVILEPFRLASAEIAKNLAQMNIILPNKISASVVAKTWSGSLTIEGGNFTIPKLGTIKLGIPDITFSLKDPSKAIDAIAKQWANEIVNSINQLGAALTKAGKTFEEVANKTTVQTGQTIAQTVNQMSSEAQTLAMQTQQAAEKAGETVKKGAEAAGTTVKKGAETVGTTVKKGAEAVGETGKKIWKGIFGGG
jgi:hypothetical protein